MNMTEEEKAANDAARVWETERRRWLEEKGLSEADVEADVEADGEGEFVTVVQDGVTLRANLPNRLQTGHPGEEID